MLKKIDILGIEVDNYTVREAMMQVENYLDNTIMNTIETIDMKMLELAGQDETVRACIEQLDLAVIGEKEILIAADVHSSQRLSETINHDFFREFIKRIIRNHKRVFLLAETIAQEEQLEHFLVGKYEQIEVAGHCAIEEKSNDFESVVNEINSATFIKKYDLKGASSINVALKSLINKEFVLKEQQGYIVYDRFLAIWLKGLV